jgi:hypothetical protein
MRRFLDKLFYIITWAWLFRLLYKIGDAISPAGTPLVHLRYQNGCYHHVLGSLSGWALEEIAQILREAGVRKAVVKRMENGHFGFSRSVPEEIRQRLRNLLVAR